MNASAAAASRPDRRAAALLFLFAAVVVWAFPARLHGQPLPVTQLAYSAKYLCGTINTDPYSVTFTEVEIHNPHTTSVSVTIKVIQDRPFFQILVAPFNVTLGPNEAYSWTCGVTPGTPQPQSAGFVEILSARQLKVVAFYRDLVPGLITRSGSVAKKSSPPFFFFPFVRHSATFLVGDEVNPEGDVVRHETLVSVANMSNNFVNANISIVSTTGIVHAFPMQLQPNGFGTVTGADLPPQVPRPFVGGVTVQYNDVAGGVALFECEEIIQKFVLTPPTTSIAVVEVHPVPVR